MSLQIDSTLIQTGLVMGLGATLAIDLWAQLLRRATGIPPTNWSLVGRWVAGLGHGRLRLGAGDTAGLSRTDLLLGYLTHYAIGIAYAIGFLALAQALSFPVSLSSALLFGLVTVLAPWLILQPALGVGVFASSTPRPARVRIQNLATHLLFGAGLYLSWQLARVVSG